MSSTLPVPFSRRPAVLHVWAPQPEMMDSAVRAAEFSRWSYDCVGQTAAALPEGYTHDVRAGVVGRGASAWERAKSALREWEQFHLPWVRMYRRDTPIAEGEVVVFASRQLGIWALNVCRIVYVVDEPDRFGFAYGTLEGHAVSGEERFLLTRDANSEDILFEVRKFSRLEHPVVKLAGAAARAVQSRFSRDAIEALRRAVAA